MSTLDTLNSALEQIDQRRATLDPYLKAWHGESPAAYLSRASAEALDKRVRRLAVNFPRLVVSSLVDRMRVTGFRRQGQTDTEAEAWRRWRQAGLVAGSELIHTDRLLYGSAYVTIWGHRTRPRQPVAMLDSPLTSWADIDPGTGEVIRAVRRWASGGRSRAVLLEQDRITRWESASADPMAGAGWQQDGPTVSNPWGQVPTVAFTRRSSTTDHYGTSAVADILDLTDALSKVFQDAMVTSEYFARPRRWATGLEIREDEDGNPIDPFGQQRLMQSEDPDTRFGQLDPARLDGYADLSATITQQIGALTGLPAHYLGLHGDQPANADSVRAAETQLVSRAFSEQRQAEQPWGQVAAWLDAIATGAPEVPDDYVPVWADPETRTPAQAADAAVKLRQIGIPLGTLLRAPLRYEEHEIATITAEAERQQMTAAAASLGGLLP